MTPRRLLPLAAALLTAPAALAQTTTSVPAYDLSAVHRYVQPAQFWPQVQLELRRPEYALLLAVQGRRTLDDAYAANRRLGFNARQAMLGYVYMPRNAQGEGHWNYGATVRFYGDGGPVAVIPEVLVRHRLPVFGVGLFDQRLSVERTFSSGPTQALESGPAGETWGRLQLGLEARLDFTNQNHRGLVLHPRLSYEAATHLRLQKADTDPDERTIQYTSLRLALGVNPVAGLQVAPWFAYQTRYLETLPQYDANNTPTAGGKVNAVYPTFGLEVRIGGLNDRPKQIHDRY